MFTKIIHLSFLSLGLSLACPVCAVDQNETPPRTPVRVHTSPPQLISQGEEEATPGPLPLPIVTLGENDTDLEVEALDLTSPSGNPAVRNALHARWRTLVEDSLAPVVQVQPAPLRLEAPVPAPVVQVQPAPTRPGTAQKRKREE